MKLSRVRHFSASKYPIRVSRKTLFTRYCFGCLIVSPHFTCMVGADMEPLLFNGGQQVCWLARLSLAGRFLTGVALRIHESNSHRFRRIKPEGTWGIKLLASATFSRGEKMEKFKPICAESRRGLFFASSCLNILRARTRALIYYDHAEVGIEVTSTKFNSKIQLLTLFCLSAYSTKS
jgi:hypothetical protein